MIFNQIKYKWQNNNIEITENILSSMGGDRFASQNFFIIYTELKYYEHIRESIRFILSQVFSQLKRLKQQYVHCDCRGKCQEYISSGGSFL